MAICRVCFGQAGVFRKVHPECVEREKEQELGIAAWFATGDSDSLSEQVVATDAAIGREGRIALAGRMFAAHVNQIIRDRKQPSIADLTRLSDFLAAFQLGYQLPDRGYIRFVMLATLADLAAGKLPARCDDPEIGFMYEPGETIVWVFGGTQHWQEQRVRGAVPYGGLSMRIASGLYAHGGAILPQSAVENFVPVADGNMVVTDRALWYQGPNGIMRIQLDSLSYIQCVNDGVILCENHGAARNEGFMTGAGEGWFTHDIICGLRNLRCRDRIAAS